MTKALLDKLKQQQQQKKAWKIVLPTVSSWLLGKDQQLCFLSRDYLLWARLDDLIGHYNL